MNATGCLAIGGQRHQIQPYHLRYPDKQWATFREGSTLVTRAVSYGMPKIDPQFLETTFYLYDSAEAAEAGSDAGGTGFLVGIEVPIDGRPETGTAWYAVSNWHVAVRDGFSVARLHTMDGGLKIVEKDPADWYFIPGGHDVAVTPIDVNLNIDKIACIPLSMTPDDSDDIGVGDGVFMLGRFVDFDGGKKNAPAARFGNVSMLPQLVDIDGRQLEVYCLDMHSRSGFSGSPVFVYRRPGDDFTDDKFRTKRFVLFLGIHVSQFGEVITAGGKEHYGLSGMTCIAPASYIEEVINMPELKKRRDKEIARFANALKNKPLPPIDESAKKGDAEKVRDKTLERMLNTPPKPRD